MWIMVSARLTFLIEIERAEPRETSETKERGPFSQGAVRCLADGTTGAIQMGVMVGVAGMGKLHQERFTYDKAIYSTIIGVQSVFMPGAGVGASCFLLLFLTRSGIAGHDSALLSNFFGMQSLKNQSCDNSGTELHQQVDPNVRPCRQSHEGNAESDGGVEHAS